MHSLPIGSEEEEAFLLIRLPKETVDQRRQAGEASTTKVGSIFVYSDSQAEFQDVNSQKIYTLLRNSPTKSGTHSGGSQKRSCHVVSNEESDLFKISLQKDEALHLGKVKLSTLLAVPKVDEKDVSTVSV